MKEMSDKLRRLLELVEKRKEAGVYFNYDNPPKTLCEAYEFFESCEANDYGNYRDSPIFQLGFAEGYECGWNENQQE